MTLPTEKPTPLPRKSPRQGRSKALVDALVEACAMLMERGDDVANLTTNRIAEVAGVTIGSLYQYFPNKEAIMAAVFARKMSAQRAIFAEQATERILARSAESLTNAVCEVVTVKAELHAQFLSLHGHFYQEYHDFFAFETTVENFISGDLQQPNWTAWLKKLLSHYHHELAVDDIELAAFLISNVIDSLLNAALIHHPDWLEDVTFRSRITQAALGAVTTVPE